MTIEIKNLRNKDYHGKPWQFRVDRHTPVGNPYYMHNESEREMVCDKYEGYFHSRLLHSTEAQTYLQTMLDVRNKYGHIELFCWCAPRRCHAETIRNWLLSQ